MNKVTLKSQHVSTWQLSDDEREHLADGVTVIYKWEIDEYSDTSWLGVFTSRATDTTVKRKFVGHGQHDYIEPEQSFAERFESYQKYHAEQGIERPITEAAKRAKRELDEDCDMLERYNDGRMNDWVCTAVLKIDGDAVYSVSVGGVSNPKSNYRREIEREQLAELRSGAETHLRDAAMRAFRRTRLWRAFEQAQGASNAAAADGENSEKK